MGLAINSAGIVTQMGAGPDRSGRAILQMMRIEQAKYIATGTGYRIAGMGDGMAAVSNALDTDIFTGNGGLGYTSSGTWTASATANTISHPSAWIRLAAYIDGVATGLEIIIQRSSVILAGRENYLIIAVSLAGFSGSGTATACPTGGTYKLLTIGSVLNGEGALLFGLNNTQAGNTAIQILTSTDAVNGVLPVGILVSANTGTGWLFILDAIDDASPTDDYPLVAFADYWGNILPGNSHGGGTIWDNSAQNVWTPGASGVWTECKLCTYGAANGQLIADSATANGASPIDSRIVALPAIFSVETTGWIKGCANALRVHTPIAGSSDLAYATYWCDAVSDHTPRMSLGGISVPAYVGFVPALTALTNNNKLYDVSGTGEGAAADLTAPEIDNVLPAAGPMAPTEAITGDITDNEMLASYTLSFYFTNLDREELIWDGDAYTSRYSSSSRNSIDGNGGYEFSVERTGGWPDEGTFKARAVDAGGNVATFTRAYTLDEVVIPGISDISPAPGDGLTAMMPVSFKLRAPTGVAVMAVMAQFELPDEPDDVETIWDNDGFTPKYAEGSTMTPVGALGGDFVVLRHDGWPSVPIFKTIVADQDGRVV